MASIKNFIKNYSSLAYFSLVFIISWSAVYLLAGPDGFPITEDQAMVMGMAILLGPTLASIILTQILYGRSGFRNLLSGLFQWRIGIRWYVAALFIAPLSTAIILSLSSLFSSEFVPGVSLSTDSLVPVISGFIGGLIVGFFEELGWTGFAVPALKKNYGLLGTGVIAGIIWGAWHFPLFWEVHSFNALLPFTLLVVRLFSWLPAYRILMVWIYDKTESLFLIILMHASLVCTLLVLDPVVQGRDLVIFILARAILFWMIAAAITVRGR